MKRIIIAAALAASTLALAACEMPEEPSAAADQGKPTKVVKKHKQGGKDKAAEPTETMGQENARNSAESYLEGQAFSRSGLIKQLKFEGFSKADAVYAVDAVSPDWNRQAAKSAKSYLDGQSFSASGLQDQLEFEGFTATQAAYGVDKAGY